MLEHLIIGKRSVGHGREQPGDGTGSLRVLCQPHSLIRSQCPNPNDDRYGSRLFKGAVQCATAFRTREEEIRPRTAEEANRVDPCRAERGDELAQGRHIYSTLSVAWSDGEGGKPA